MERAGREREREGARERGSKKGTGEGGRENFSHGKKYLPLSSEDESPGQSVDVFDLLCQSQELCQVPRRLTLFSLLVDIELQPHHRDTLVIREPLHRKTEL